MADEIEEIEEEGISAEELFEQHKAEIDEAFKEKGFFTRLGDMFMGLSKPKSSPEYKVAVVELKRLMAPLLAILLPTLGVIILIVVTAISGQVKETIQVDISKIEEEETQLEEETPPDEPDEPPPEEPVDIQVDTPDVNMSNMVAPNATPTSEPLSVKPATQESVSLVKSPIRMKSIAGLRNPGTIGKMTSGGSNLGDANTEAAVLKALRWLKKTQNSDGSWKPSPISNTGLAILAYLAHGETPANSKEFGKTVQNAIQFLINAQCNNADGDATYRGTDGNEYATLIATYALCEAYGMTSHPTTKIAAQRGLERIIKNQSPTGGWDYKMRKDSTRDDMSFEGWALQAVKAGKMAGLHPDGLDECIKKAIKCLKTRNFRDNGFNYTAGGRPTGLTATGCLCMQLLGYGDEPEVKASLESMKAWLPTFEGKGGFTPGGPLPSGNPQYYSYYASQCKYQAGMCQGATPENTKLWQEWNLEMKRLYPSSIFTPEETIEGIDGKPKKIGFWKHIDRTCGGGGTVMSTCLCALQLMVYYRYLPTTKIDGGVKTDKKAAADTKKEDAKKKAKEVSVEVDI